jgi:hypothetical protein
MTTAPRAQTTAMPAKPGASLRSVESGPLKVDEETLRFKLSWEGRLFLAYNKGSVQYGDFYRSKPDFFPVLTPTGRPVTQTRAYRFNHHQSIWIGHAKINGVNVFHDNNPQRINLGDIVIERAAESFVPVPRSLMTETPTGDTAPAKPPTSAPPAALAAWRLETTNGWIAKDGRRLCTERRDITITPDAFGGRAHVIDLLSRLEATEGPIDLAQDVHAYLGVRVADTMDEEDGGRIRNANRQETEAACMQQVATWCDYTGQVVGQPAGVALLVHPSNPETGFFTRGYGTMLANPTLLRSLRVEAGGALEQRFRLIVHDGDCDYEMLDAAQRQFAAD